MRSRRGLVLEVVVVLGWALAVATVALLIPARGWAAIAIQVLAYALIVAPVLVRVPRSTFPLGTSGRTLALSAGLLIAAVGFAAWTFDDPLSEALRHGMSAASAGIGEELLFRGYLFARLRRLVGSGVLRGALGVGCFVLFHVPLVLVRDEPVVALVPVVLLGIVFTWVRSVSGGLLLPTALHVAVDLSS